MDFTVAAASAIIGFVLLLAGIPKLTDNESVVRSIRGYKILPSVLEAPVARALPIAETATGILLVTGIARQWAAGAAAIMFTSFFLGLTVNLLRGRRDLDCGCFAFGLGEIPRIGWFHALRAGVLAVASLAIVVIGSSATLPLQVAGSALALLLVLAGVAAAQIRSVVHLGRRPVDDYLSGASIRLRAANATSRYGA